MKRSILIDGTFLGKFEDGLGTYTLCNLKSLVDLFPQEFDLKIIVNKNSISKYYLELLLTLDLTIIYSKIKPIGILREFHFLLLSKKFSFDVFWSPSNFSPLFIKNAVWTIHDLTFLTNPNYGQKFYLAKKIYFKALIYFGILNSKKIICVSKYTLNQVKSNFNLVFKRNHSKFLVIYEGVLACSAVFRKGTKFHKRTLLYLGSSRRHKNLFNLLVAFERVIGVSTLNLVLVGNMQFLSSDERSIIERINKKAIRIKLVGYVSRCELERLYSDSKALIFPSFSEGFGLPILEAFNHKIPVLCSGIEPFIEITNGEALFFNPHSVGSIVNTILRLESMSSEEYDALVVRGSKRLNNFSWDFSARELSKLFKA